MALRTHLLTRFHLVHEGSQLEKFLAFFQTASVDEYCKSFEILFSSLFRLSEDVLEANFLNRLKPDIQAEVHLLRIVGLT